MSVTFVNAATSPSPTFNNVAGGVSNDAQNVTAGNDLVVFATAKSAATDVTGNATCSDTAGNTFVRIAGASGICAVSGMQIIAFRALNCLGNAANVVTCDLGPTGLTNYVSIHVLQFATAHTFDTSTKGQLDSGSYATSFTSPAFSTALADAVAVMCGRIDDAIATGLTFTAGSGFTIPANGTSGDGISAAEYQIYTALQSSVTAGMSCSGANTGWQVGLVVLDGAGGDLSVSGIGEPVIGSSTF